MALPQVIFKPDRLFISGTGGVYGRTAAADPNNPGTTNLISWWSLDETSGTRNDSHGTNHLTDNNTVLSAAGKQSNAADFERGNSEFLSIADNASLSVGNEDFTLGIWIYAESLPTGSTNSWIMAKFNNPSGGEYGIYHRGPDDRFAFVISHNGTSHVVENADNLGAPSLATWYFIVAWYDATNDTMNIQVNNGTVDSQSNTTGANDGTSSFRIGFAQNIATQSYDGLADEAFFYKRVLTADERTWLYNSGNGRAYSELS